MPVVLSVGRLPPAQSGHQTPHRAELAANFPTVVTIIPGSVHDVNMLAQLVYEAASFHIPDRGYLHFARGHRLQQHSAFFVTRAKKNFRFLRR